MPGLTLGDTVPNLEVETTHGVIKLHDYIDTWTILFSHPCWCICIYTSRACVISHQSVPPSLVRWQLMLQNLLREGPSFWDCPVMMFCLILKLTPLDARYPIIADPNRELIKQLNMVDPDEKDSSGHKVPSRSLHIVGADMRIKLSFLYPASTGRNMDEVVRVLDSLQRASKYKIATPANWKPREDVVISPSVSDEEAKKLFPQGFKIVDLPSKKEYLRFTNVDD